MEQNTELLDKSLAMPNKAASIKVIDQASYEVAGDFLKGIKTLRAEINNTFKPIIDKAYAAHKEAVAQRRRIEDPLIMSEALIKPKIGIYLDDQEKKKREEEARRFATAKKKQEEAQLAEAAELEKAGEHEAAEAVISQPVDTPPVVLPTAPNKVSGIAKQENWKHQVIDESKVPISFRCIDHMKLGQFARTWKDNAKVPGVRFYKVISVSSGKR